MPIDIMGRSATRHAEMVLKFRDVEQVYRAVLIDICCGATDRQRSGRTHKTGAEPGAVAQVDHEVGIEVAQPLMIAHMLDTLIYSAGIAVVAQHFVVAATCDRLMLAYAAHAGVGRADVRIRTIRIRCADEECEVCRQGAVRVDGERVYRGSAHLHVALRPVDERIARVVGRDDSYRRPVVIDAISGCAASGDGRYARGNRAGARYILWNRDGICL